MSGVSKRQCGQFYTIKNPFTHRKFRDWAKRARLPDATILEPFAGCGSLIDHLEKMKLCNGYEAYDIHPTSSRVKRRDTLSFFPRGFDICITNPPWLAKNSATCRGLGFPDTSYDDLYKFSVALCLDNCSYLAALVPESFIRSGLFRDRLYSFISLTEPIFEDTTHPVGLALFMPYASHHITVYSGNKKVGPLADIEKNYPEVDTSRKIVFNSPKGNLGLIAVDSTSGASIRFCDPRDLDGYSVESSCRYITRLSVDSKVGIDRLNECLHQFREKTCDILMTSYRGLRKDGKYRRRLDWQLARGLICNA